MAAFCARDGVVPAYHHPYIHADMSPQPALGGSDNALGACDTVLKAPIVVFEYDAACTAPGQPVDQASRIVRNLILIIVSIDERPVATPQRAPSVRELPGYRW